MVGSTSRLTLREARCYTRRMDISTIEALTFDVFGTVVDWRGTITREGSRIGAEKGIDADWAEFADAWRGGYEPAMRRVRWGSVPGRRSTSFIGRYSTACWTDSASPS